MDAGPSYSYQRDLKNAYPVWRKGDGICMVQTCHLLHCLSIS
jgi:hypothetical protein